MNELNLKQESAANCELKASLENYFMNRFIPILFLLVSCTDKSQSNKSFALALKSDTLIIQNRLSEAEQVIKEAIHLDSSNYIAYNNLAIVRIKTNSPSEKVVDAFTKSLAINPYYATALFSLTNFYYDKKDYSNAIIYSTKYLSILKKGSESDSDISRLYTIRAESRNMKKEFDEALLDSDSALNYNKNSYWAYKERGSAYRQLNLYTDAITNYSKALDINPAYAQAYNGLAICYDDAKIDFNKALINYTKAIELDPKNGTYVYNRGACLYDNGFKEKARPDFIKADSLGKFEAKSYLKKYL